MTMTTTSIPLRRPQRFLPLLVAVGVTLTTGLLAFAASEGKSTTEGGAVSATDAPTHFTDEKSPWLLAPVFSSNPKLGTSVGALGGYIHYFDPQSRPSIFALTGQYSDTESIVAGMMGKTSFNEDRDRIVGGMLYGNVKNDYDDYLGTGVPLKSEGELRSIIVRYLHRVKGNWFLGGQGVSQNFQINGDSAFDQEVLNLSGAKPYESGGLGLAVNYDSRDNEHAPTQGWYFNASNLAYREVLGGEDDFDIYRIEVRYFLKHGDGHVLALRQLNHFTNDAPTSARASVQLRGYKFGQYNANRMSSLEVEERWRLARRWTLTAFAGGAYLYGGNNAATNEKSFYSSYGGGFQFLLKPKEGIVMNLEYAQGEGENKGVYLKMGYAY
jgi:hypothetical protein